MDTLQRFPLVWCLAASAAATKISICRKVIFIVKAYEFIASHYFTR